MMLVFLNGNCIVEIKLQEDEELLVGAFGGANLRLRTVDRM
jgi:hypothetical protein